MTQFVGCTGYWVHPSKQTVEIVIDGSQQIAFCRNNPHGKVIVYTDEPSGEDMLIMVCSGKINSTNLTSQRTNLLRYVAPGVFREINNMYFSVVLRENREWKRMKYSLKLPEKFIHKNRFEQQAVYAWMHPKRETHCLHFGTVESEHRIVYEAKRREKQRLSKVHGG